MLAASDRCTLIVQVLSTLSGPEPAVRLLDRPESWGNSLSIKWDQVRWALVKAVRRCVSALMRAGRRGAPAGAAGRADTAR